MKPRFISALVLSVLAFCLNASAQTVSPEAARAKAKDFFSTGARNLPAKKGVKRQAPAVGNIELAYTSEKDGKPCFYVFNNGDDGGFVIVGGDEAGKEILAYVPQGHFDYETAPDNLKWWLSRYENISNIPRKSDANSKYHDVPNLITSKWHQGTPYNSVIKTVSGIDYPTGCAATAVAQIMKFWNYPEQGQGSHTDRYYPSFSADFGSTTYDWGNMLDSYDCEYTKTQAEAVGTLMYQVGVALDIRYNTEGSGKFSYIDNDTDVHNGIDALVEYFNYDKGLTSICRANYSLEEWKALLYDELLTGRPIYYEGNVKTSDTYIGHSFVCHGYSAELDMFSFNWGWGDDSGYLTIGESDDFLASSTYGSAENITIGIQPPKESDANDVCYGDTFSEGYLTYMINSINQHTVSVIQSDKEVEHVVVPSSVMYKNENYTVSRIEAYAFRSCHMTEIELPSTIQSTGNGFLQNCVFLQSISIPESVKVLGGAAFESCWNLESVQLPSTITKIKSSTFHGCWALREIYIPDNIVQIHDGAFRECRSLEYVSLPNNLELMLNLFEDSQNLYNLECRALTPPEYAGSYLDGYRQIRKMMAYNIEQCTLWVPASSINAYKSAEGWKEFGEIRAIEDRPDDISSEEFVVDGLRFSRRFDKLKLIGYSEVQENIIIPSTVSYKGATYKVTAIGSRAFAHSSCRSVFIPEGVLDIQEQAFCECRNLEEVIIPKSLKRIGVWAFNWTGIKQLSIPQDSHLILVDESFNGCDDLENVYIGKCHSLFHAFMDCKKLKSVYLGDVYSSQSSFAGCETLSEIILSDKVKIYTEGLELPQLKKMVSFADAATEEELPYYDEIFWTLSAGQSNPNLRPFTDCQADGTLFVPATSIETYKSSEPWQSWGNIVPIVPLTSLNIVENLTIDVGQNEPIDTILSPVDATVKHCIWASSDPTIASVDYNGVVTAHKAGSVTITATSMYHPDVTAYCTVTVLPNVGDTNSDGNVTLADMPPLLTYLLTGNASEVNLRNADVNGDGVVSIADLTALIKKLQDVNQ